MKKIVFTLSMVVCAASVQAASYLWSNFNSINAYDQPGGEGALQESGTIYLINASAISQKTFVETMALSFNESTFNTLVASAENSGTLTTGSLLASAAKGEIVGGKVTWATSDVGSQTFYEVLFDAGNDAYYISEALTTDVKGMGTTDFLFNNDGAYYNHAYIGEMTFVGDGWYSIPEPTSGLLLLVGLAGLALKRKRA